MIDRYALGIMSGTSLDGLDLALCHFKLQNNIWEFRIEEVKTVNYDKEWKERLENSPILSAYQLIKLHRDYGVFIGNQVNEFLMNCRAIPSIIASHGHTVFHEPQNKINFQIGDGASIAAITGITTISDFRSLDINLGGQGAPLVPVGDFLLFNQYDYCVNLGGFANISHLDNQNKLIAYDICPVNTVLNSIVSEVGLAFDKGGNQGRKGNVDQLLLEKLNNISYYKIPPPKSLGREWLISELMPLFENSSLLMYDKLRTFYEHVAFQIYMCFEVGNQNKLKNKKAIITGGGAFNKYLIELIQTKTSVEVIVPEKIIVEFKEALIFAFLGVLRHEKMINCYKSVTGAQIDSCGGQIFYAS